MTGPYAQAADAYWTAGWRGILPLPAKAKKNPPTGYTGERGIDPSYADVHAWATGPEGNGNIALRLPRNVIGLDVDNYGDKAGAVALEQAINQYGDLPPTWRTTSRDDGVSGIRLYRVPEGLAWPGELGAATEIIQHGHRYAIVGPSLHPEGRTYRWINPAGITSTAIPDPDELPPLPDSWVAGLTRGELATTTLRNTWGTAQTAGWLVTLPGALSAPCQRMSKAIDQMSSDLLGSAHTAARDGALRAIRLASEAHAGLVTALAEMQRQFAAEATNPERTLLGKARRTDDEAAKEWEDIVTSACNLVAANPSPGATCDCDGQLTASIVGGVGLVSGTAALAPQPEPTTAEQETHPAEAVARLKDGATFILDAPEDIPTIWGDGDEVLWAEGEALMLVGPPGVGKTTLTGQIVRARLGLASDVLGITVNTTSRRILYLAMDRPRQIARALRRTFDPADRPVLEERLRVWEGPPPADVARNTDILVALAQLADADTLIVDSLKDAAIGLTEDEIAAGYNRARQKALAHGVQVLELHHLVKRGANGSKPNTLADVYGSAWLTAGAGSVLLVWGNAGDLVVDLAHLKQPAAEVGPMKVLHDHTSGSSSIFHATDLLQLAMAAGMGGIKARDAARAMFDKDNPSDPEKEKARRKLKKLATAGHLIEVDSGDPKVGTSYFTPVFAPHAGSTHAHAPEMSDQPTQPTAPHAGPQNTLNNTPRTPPRSPRTSDAHPPTNSPPSERGGSEVSADDDQEQILACRICGEITDDIVGGECHDCRWTR